MWLPGVSMLVVQLVMLYQSMIVSVHQGLTAINLPGPCALTILKCPTTIGFVSPSPPTASANSSFPFASTSASASHVTTAFNATAMPGNKPELLSKDDGYWTASSLGLDGYWWPIKNQPGAVSRSQSDPDLSTSVPLAAPAAHGDKTPAKTTKMAMSPKPDFATGQDENLTVLRRDSHVFVPTPGKRVLDRSRPTSLPEEIAAAKLRIQSVVASILRRRPRLPRRVLSNGKDASLLMGMADEVYQINNAAPRPLRYAFIVLARGSLGLLALSCVIILAFRLLAPLLPSLRLAHHLTAAMLDIWKLKQQNAELQRVYQREFADLEKKISKHSDEIKRLKSIDKVNEDLEKARKDLEHQITGIEARHNVRARIDAKIQERISRDLEKATQDRETMESRLKETQDSLTSFSERQIKDQQQMRELQTSLNSQKLLGENLQSLNANLQNENSSLEKSISRVAEEMRHLKELYEAQQSTLTEDFELRFRTQNEELEQAVEARVMDIREQERSTMTAELNEQMEEVRQSYQTVIDDQARSLAGAKVKRRRAEVLFEMSQDSKKSSKYMRKQAQAAEKILQASLTESETDKATVQAQLVDALKNLTDRTATMEEWQQEAQEYAATTKATEQQLRNENAEMKRQLEEYARTPERKKKVSKKDKKPIAVTPSDEKPAPRVQLPPKTPHIQESDKKSANSELASQAQVSVQESVIDSKKAIAKETAPKKASEAKVSAKEPAQSKSVNTLPAARSTSKDAENLPTKDSKAPITGEKSGESTSKQGDLEEKSTNSRPVIQGQQSDVAVKDTKDAGVSTVKDPKTPAVKGKIPKDTSETKKPAKKSAKSDQASKSKSGNTSVKKVSGAPPKPVVKDANNRTSKGKAPETGPQIEKPVEKAAKSEAATTEQTLKPPVKRASQDSNKLTPKSKSTQIPGSSSENPIVIPDDPAEFVDTSGQQEVKSTSSVKEPVIKIEPSEEKPDTSTPSSDPKPDQEPEKTVATPVTAATSETKSASQTEHSGAQAGPSAPAETEPKKKTEKPGGTAGIPTTSSEPKPVEEPKKPVEGPKKPAIKLRLSAPKPAEQVKKPTVRFSDAVPAPEKAPEGLARAGVPPRSTVVPFNMGTAAQTNPRAQTASVVENTVPLPTNTFDQPAQPVVSQIYDFDTEILDAPPTGGDESRLPVEEDVQMGESSPNIPWDNNNNDNRDFELPDAPVQEDVAMDEDVVRPDTDTQDLAIGVDDFMEQLRRNGELQQPGQVAQGSVVPAYQTPSQPLRNPWNLETRPERYDFDREELGHTDEVLDAMAMDSPQEMQTKFDSFGGTNVQNQPWPTPSQSMPAPPAATTSQPAETPYVSPPGPFDPSRYENDLGMDFNIDFDEDFGQIQTSLDQGMANVATKPPPTQRQAPAPLSTVPTAPASLPSAMEGLRHTRTEPLQSIAANPQQLTPPNAAVQTAAPFPGPRPEMDYLALKKQQARESVIRSRNLRPAPTPLASVPARPQTPTQLPRNDEQAPVLSPTSHPVASPQTPTQLPGNNQQAPTLSSGSHPPTAPQSPTQSADKRGTKRKGRDRSRSRSRPRSPEEHRTKLTKSNDSLRPKEILEEAKFQQPAASSPLIGTLKASQSSNVQASQAAEPKTDGSSCEDKGKQIEEENVASPVATQTTPPPGQAQAGQSAPPKKRPGEELVAPPRSGRHPHRNRRAATDDEASRFMKPRDAASAEQARRSAQTANSAAVPVEPPRRVSDITPAQSLDIINRFTQRVTSAEATQAAREQTRPGRRGALWNPEPWVQQRSAHYAVDPSDPNQLRLTDDEVSTRGREKKNYDWRKG